MRQFAARARADTWRAAEARGARGLGAGCATCAHRLGQLGARAPDLVFQLGFSTRYFS